MDSTIEKLPKTKQEELLKLTQTISGNNKVEMIILFGSYAKATWVEDSYYENGTLYEYRSDYDLLVILKHEDFQYKVKIEDEVNSKLIATGQVTTPLSMIFHGIKQINKALTAGNYFFKDIKNEGIVLYDTGKHKLTNPKKLTPAQYQQKAQEYFNQWFESATKFMKLFNFSFNEGDYHEAAFLLHQAVERYYTAILLVYTDYRPKDHNLETLGIKVAMCNKAFLVFPKTNNEEKRLFELLKKAYIDARYNMNEYHITKDDLQYLSEKVSQLKTQTEGICKEKMMQIGEGN